jgi:cyclopropane fatty-acyl-phospholipid synthase-like methyltransferase
MKLLDASKEKERGMIRKPSSYFAEYDLWFGPLADQELNILEIGVESGGLLYAWKKFFPKAQITGIDILPRCKEYAGERIAVEIGSQSDIDFLKKVETVHGPFDIIIDDGSHKTKDQIRTFQFLFPLLKDGGIYVVEDIHTSYYARYRNSKPFTKFIGEIIDDMHAWTKIRSDRSFFQRAKNKLHHPIMKATPHDLVRSVYVASGICFIQKGLVEKDKNVKI